MKSKIFAKKCFVRFDKNGKSTFGIYKEGLIDILDKSFFCKDSTVIGEIAVSSVKLLAPVEPSKIVAIGLNYASHIGELHPEITGIPSPKLFIKPSTAIIGPDDKIIYPDMTHHVDYEAELGVVIGERTKNVTVQEAKDSVLGYCCLNDVTARDLQKSDGQWTRAKSFDTFCPIGPAIARNVDPFNLEIECFVNGKLRQSGNSSLMIKNVYELISFISKIMTLLPGDIIATGTPKGVGEIKPGDEVTIKINKIGELTNYVAGIR